jgi:pimeloyl-ACP methyl ester carboxylesterase
VTRRAHILLATLIAASGLAGFVSFSYKNELREARDATNRGSLIATTAAGPIEYGQSGAGIPLLSIHGAGGGHDQGLANAIDLVGEGYHVIAPSRFGYLRTPIPAAPSPAAQADAHAALLSQLNVSEAIVVGVSAGARSAVEFALRHPQRLTALILIVPGTYSPTSPVAIEESRGSQLAFWLVNHGADFAWWAAETISPSMLIRFIGVPPELVWSSPKNRARQGHENCPEHRTAFVALSWNQYRQQFQSPFAAAREDRSPDTDHFRAGRLVQHIARRRIRGKQNPQFDVGRL